MPSRFFSSSVVAYASLTLPSSLDQCSDLDALRNWSLTKPVQMEILAEAIHPSEFRRPLWNEILNEIERGGITTLIVPSLFHIAGEDVIGLSRFLNFLKMHGVVLRSLKENIHNRRNSRREIIASLQNNRGENYSEVLNERA